MGKQARAEVSTREGLRIEGEFVARTIAMSSEARAAGLQDIFSGCDQLLWVLRRNAQTRGDRRLRRPLAEPRARITHVLQRRQAIAASPQAKAVLSKLQSTAEQMARLTLSVPTPQQRETRQKQLGELNDRKERLEVQLAQASDFAARNR